MPNINPLFFCPSGTVLKRPLVGVPAGWHYGIVFDGTVWELSKESGFRIVTYEEFACGLEVSRDESIVSTLPLEQVKQRAEAVKHIPYNFALFNCETFVRFCHGKLALSMQIAFLGLVGAAGALLYFKKQ